MTDRVTIEQFSADQTFYSTLKADWKNKRKSPRFAFLKISATAHCTHLQSSSSQPATQALQKSAILPTLNQVILHKDHLRLKNK